MKAERRHELKENALQRFLFELPVLARTYSTQISVGVIVVSLLIIFFRYRASTNAQHLQDARLSLTQASLDLKRLASFASTPAGTEQEAAQQRQTWYSDGLSRADEALQKTAGQDLNMSARALVAKGDLNFELANLPDLPGAATQPSLQPQLSKSDLLNAAEDAYNEVVNAPPPDHFWIIAAHFGLAAVAEDRAGLAGGGDASGWDIARQQYQAVIDDNNVPSTYKQYADYRQNLLDQLAKVAPTTLPGATIVPATMPASVIIPSDTNFADNSAPTTRQ